VDVLERSSLRAVTVNGHVFTLQGLNDKVGDNSTVVRVHSGTESVEDSGNSDIDTVLSLVTVGQGLGNSLTLVVTGSDTDRVDVTPVFFGLGVDFRVTVDFGSRGDQESGLDSLGETEHVQGTHERGLDSLDRVVLVVRGRGGTSQVVDLVNFDQEGLDNIVSNHFKVGVTDPVGNGGSGTGEEVVQNGNFVTEEHQSVDQVGTDETSTTGDEDSLSLSVWQELDRGELGHGGVGDGVVILVVGRLSTVSSFNAVGGSVALDDLGSQVQASQSVSVDSRVEVELVVTNGLVSSHDDR
jgi:hypothetical protein